MTKLNVYSSGGRKISTMNYPKSMEESVNMELLAQAIRVYEAGRHQGLSKTKTRGEISASKRKIYRQKGTGRARHGALSAPIFVGGGVAHGPKGIKRILVMPKKMRKKALKVALSLKAKEGEMFVVDRIHTLKKTKEAATLINKIAKSEKNAKEHGRYTFILSDGNSDTRLVLRNLANIEVSGFKDLNAYKVYFGGVLLVDKDALKTKKEPSVKIEKNIGKSKK